MLTNTINPTKIEALPNVSEFIDRAMSIKPYVDTVYAGPIFGYDSTMDCITVKEKDSIRPEQYIGKGTPEKQIAIRLGLPTALPEKAREIGATSELAGVFNKAVHHNNRDFLMRQDGSEMIFAALTPSYARMDNYHVLPGLLERFDDGEWKAQQWNITPEFSRVDLVHVPSLRTIDGKPIIFGLTWTNSEAGLGKASMWGRIMALICSNGMMRSIMSNRTSYVHRGRKHRPGSLDMSSDFGTTIDIVPDKNGIFTAAVDTANTVERAMGMTYSLDKEEVIYGLADWTGASFAEREAMLQGSSQYENSLWGYANILNHVSHQPSAKRNHELERLAWDLTEKGLRKPTMINDFATTGNRLIARELELSH